MNIYALKGHRVLAKNLESGYPMDSEKAKKFLVKNQQYTVEKTIVNNFSTRVHLQEIPNESFNSVHFESITDQPKELDINHPDWNKWN